MAKKVQAVVKIQLPAGSATPAPPVGPALGQHGVNIGAFVQAFNEKTRHQAGLVIPVVITIYIDRTFSFVTKTPPAAVLLKRAAGLAKGSGVPNREKVGKVVPWCKMTISMGKDLGDKKVVIQTPRPENYRGDMSDFPHFSEPRWSVMDSLRVSLNNLAILFFWNVLFFVSAHYIFVKRSLR